MKERIKRRWRRFRLNNLRRAFKLYVAFYTLMWKMSYRVALYAVNKLAKEGVVPEVPKGKREYPVAEDRY